LGYYRYQTLANNNIYVLLESLLIVSYFKTNKEMSLKWRFDLLLVLLVLSWISENFIFQRITAHSCYFHIGYSLTIVVLSINLINKLLFQNHANLLRNADFVLCLCFVIYFTYKAIIEALTIYGIQANLAFWLRIYDIMAYINLGVNLLYILAILWMRKKAKYILPLY
jgi:hypothetical protein